MSKDCGQYICTQCGERFEDLQGYDESFSHEFGTEVKVWQGCPYCGSPEYEEYDCLEDEDIEEILLNVRQSRES